MDSRLIAGAYSQHFRALEQDQREQSDSIARAKKLSQETNKRRKVQAQKRKLEARKEEQRRQEILTKRREEQKQATEKYQRSHVPTGSRQNSGRLSPQRYAAPCLDDALQLIRRSPRRERPSSGRDGMNSPKNEDPLKRSYFHKMRHHSARPSSGRSSQLNNEARAELMDYSLKNLTSSKSLFEQQLEQQQNLLLQKQQQSLREFSDAVNKELASGNGFENQESEDEVENPEMALSDSCSSLDSLERSDNGNEGNILEDEKNGMNEPVTEKSHSGDSSGHGQGFYLNPLLSEAQNGKNNFRSHQVFTPLNQDMTPSAVFQKETISDSQQKFNMNINEEGKEKILPAGYSNGVTKLELLDQHNSNVYNDLKSPLKQISGDSLEELESSSSSISVIKVPENNDHSVKSMGARAAPDNFVNFKYNSIFQGDERKQQNIALLSNQGINQEVTNEGYGMRDNQFRDQNAQTSGTPSNLTAWELQSNGQGANNKNPISVITTVRNEPVIESYNPRYASAIGLSIWPGPNPANVNLASTGTSVSNNNSNIDSPYGKRTSSVSIAPNMMNTSPQKPAVKNPSPQSTQAGIPSKTENGNVSSGANISSAFIMTPAVTNSKPSIPEMVGNSTLTAFKKQDLIYPLSQNYAQNSNPQNHMLLPSHNTSTYDTLQQEIKQLSDQILEHNMVTASPSLLSAPNTPNTMTTALSASSEQQSERPQMIHHIPHANDFASGPVPVPAVRTIFPMNKPPVPHTYTSQQSQSNNKLDNLKPNSEDNKENDSSKTLISSNPNESVQGEHGNNDEEEESENVKTLKGILKRLPPKVPNPGQQKGAVQARDSLELAKMQNDKKVKKKSVRFAAFVEENEEEYTAEDATNSHMVVTNSYRQGLNRPSSAKIVSQQSKFTVTSKPIRAASAGSVRQQSGLPQNNSTLTENGAKTVLTHSNLPPQFSHPLNTTAPINRPKAAAHIIMSSESHQPFHKNESGSLNTAASSLHKSQLEMKVKAINNNFMSKVPVKMSTANNVLVYQVANPSPVSTALGDHTQQTQLNTERSRIRDNNTSSKRVPLSNSTITRTSIVPASTKINYPISNGAAPSYSTNINNNTQSSVSTLEENKIRVDKTPTDEEIAWVWDKVRNCLDKEGDKAETKQTSPSGTEQVTRQTPTLSTKIIDGNSLGFNTNGAPALRPGSGYFYTTRNGGGAATNGHNKIKPAVQQQGSYLRRYGLLQQRRVNSATGTPSGPVTVQARAGSAGMMRYPTMHANQQGQQQQQVEGPKPLAFSYKPQDQVSESTAAFIMAERLAKQSLSDSHIAVGMEDAQSKQEAFNNRSRMAHIGGGPSALSLEEQRLMESLDKLNERLNVTDQKPYSGTIHYHQPYQPHLPGFRGHQGLNNPRHQLSPRGQQRSHSARIRQQIRQYR